MCRWYSWPPDFWEDMGWMQFRGWLRQARESKERHAGRSQAPPDSWDGAENDAFWQQAHAKRREERGW